MKKLNNKGFSLIEILIAVFVIVLVVGLGFYAKNKMSNKLSLADNSYTVWKAQGYDVRACRPKNGYNPITAYVYPQDYNAKSNFKKFIVKIANSTDPKQSVSAGDGQAHANYYKNPFGVNALMAASVIKSDNSTISPYPVQITSIKVCP